MQSDKTVTTSETDNSSYTMRISRLTIDKLGVKLYDKISAVVAELIANSYDADAKTVTVKLPLNTVLAKPKRKKKEDAENAVEDYPEYEIIVKDDGHGMTPQEARDYFLITGRDRRKIKGKGGDLSREEGRPVMGRKGIGKLAPFGVCRMIEIISAGGEKKEEGYLVSHFFMDYDKIVTADDAPAKLDAGEFDNTYFEKRGTTVRLSNFLPKRVPDSETIHRQLATRFVFADPNFKIVIEDTRNPELNPKKPVESVSIPVDDDTRIDVSNRPVVTEDGEELPVTGWLAMGKNPYKYDELAGVRIYARNKIVAQTRDFGRKAGFTGEFYTRSYLVGDIRAEWLDEEEDLITSDRQRIIWDSDYGRALSNWGGEMIKEIAEKTFAPRRKATKKKFLEVSDFVKRAEARFGDKADVVNTAVELAEKIGGFADSDELGSTSYVDDLCEIILTVAPHKMLIDAFQEFNSEVSKESPSIDEAVDLFDKTRIAEMATYSLIASERVKAIKNLRKIVYKEKDESKFQELLADAPWLIEPKWSILTSNRSLSTFKQAFEEKWKEKHDEDVVLAIGEDLKGKRPDFTAAHIGYLLHFVEIKPAKHKFNNGDFDRLYNYIIFLKDLFEKNEVIKKDFPDGWKIDIICDEENLSGYQKETYDKYVGQGLINKMETWQDFLGRAEQTHEMFMKVADKSGS